MPSISNTSPIKYKFSTILDSKVSGLIFFNDIPPWVTCDLLKSPYPVILILNEVKYLSNLLNSLVVRDLIYASGFISALSNIILINLVSKNFNNTSYTVRSLYCSLK